jgi:hypothetical protein
MHSYPNRKTSQKEYHMYQPMNAYVQLILVAINISLLEIFTINL